MGSTAVDEVAWGAHRAEALAALAAGSDLGTTGAVATHQARGATCLGLVLVHRAFRAEGSAIGSTEPASITLQASYDPCCAVVASRAAHAAGAAIAAVL